MTIVLFILSWLLVAFGQPALLKPLGIAASAGGFALFWYILVDLESQKKKFYSATLWFFLIQVVQLWWLTSHPYIYSYAVLGLVALAMGAQFGLLCLFINRKRASHGCFGLFLASLWALMEWSRLFFLSGHSWNPVGLELTATLYGLQNASLFGVYGLSFLVILANAWVLRAFLLKTNKAWLLATSAVCLPYLTGAFLFHLHEKQANEAPAKLSVLLVQPAFPIEEELGFKTKQEMIAFVLDEWKQIASVLARYKDQQVDLIALPEFTVPFGTYTPIFPIEEVKRTIAERFGIEQVAKLPPALPPLAKTFKLEGGSARFINNAFWLQAFSNIFDAHVIAGLEDVEELEGGERVHYSAAVHVGKSPSSFYEADRYEKRVLVPMGEYIPFEFCKQIASWYGIGGSFTCGKEAKVMHCNQIPFGTTICYEETFGHLTRENRQLGAEFLVNLTSDVWYPNSTLTKQHLEHARLRTVENGIPLIRSCNTGVTCVIDSLGRTISELGKDHPNQEWIQDALLAEIPGYTYHTLYSRYGDIPVIAFSALFASLYCFLLLKRKKDYN